MRWRRRAHQASSRNPTRPCAATQPTNANINGRPTYLTHVPPVVGTAIKSLLAQSGASPSITMLTAPSLGADASHRNRRASSTMLAQSLTRSARAVRHWHVSTASAPETTTPHTTMSARVASAKKVGQLELPAQSRRKSTASDSGRTVEQFARSNIRYSRRRVAVDSPV